MLLEDVIRLNLSRLYHGYEILSAHAIRVTRDADVQPVAGRTAGDLLKEIEQSLRERRMGDAVRLQYDPDLPPEVLARLVEELELEPADLYPAEGFTAFTDLGQLYSAVDLPRLKDRPLVPHPVPAFEGAADIWSAIRERDILVHHPYQPFDVVTRFVQEAATDPRVLAINMTLYRVSPTSPIAKALTIAAQAGKEVAVLVELRARFDEEANIRWAQALEEVGAHVVYGLIGYKTHCKACLIVRQEADGIRRYCHLATGNYNVRTGGDLRRPGPVHLPRGVRRGPDGDLQPPDRLHAAACASTTCWWRPPGCGTRWCRRSAARRPTRARDARLASWRR